MNKIKKVLLTAAVFTGFCATAVSQEEYWTQQQVLDAICAVETGGTDDPEHAIGDNGKALGPFQIHESYFDDAKEYNDSHDDAWGLSNSVYSDVTNKATAENVIRAYMARYAGTCWFNLNEDGVRWCARIHNGGPRGNTKEATKPYADKVVAHLPPGQID